MQLLEGAGETIHRKLCLKKAVFHLCGEDMVKAPGTIELFGHESS